jgi:predicted Holliday junction resolvase-like endonuclease
VAESAKQLSLFPWRGWRAMTPFEIGTLLLLALLAGAVWREVVWRLRKRQLEQAAISRSRSVLGGKFAEQLAPFLPDFPADPTEARFLGSPVDLVVFPGLAEGNPREIVFVEVKSGNARPTAVQRRLEALVAEGRVRWKLLRINLPR